MEHFSRITIARLCRWVMFVLLVCATTPPVRAQAGGAVQAPAVPEWAQPGSSTHVQVPPPADFHRPSRNFETPIGVFQVTRTLWRHFGVGTPQVGTGDFVEIPFVHQHPAALVIKIEEGLQVAEPVGGQMSRIDPIANGLRVDVQVLGGLADGRPTPVNSFYGHGKDAPLRVRLASPRYESYGGCTGR